jgi:VWFA-related protein
VSSIHPKLAFLFFAAAAAGPSQPTFRADTRVVEVTVVATRSGGQPVTDLQASQLAVWDDGAQQNIASFERLVNGVSSSALPGSSPSANSDVPVRRSRLSVIVLDDLNTYWIDQIYGREGVSQMLAKLPPGDRIAIFALGDKLHLLHDFSDDYASLREAVDEYEGERPLLGIGDHKGPVFLPGDDLEQRNRILDTLDALTSITHRMARNPGRKNLLWISDAFPLQFNSMVGRQPLLNLFHKETEQAMRELAAADVALYPVSPHGLSISLAMDWVDSMLEMAEPTGGRAFYANNDIGALIRAALDDSRESYLLTYVPTGYREDGSFHQIQLKTTRKGVQLRYRPGYFAKPATR